MANPTPPPSPNRDILLARYKENSDQARHHETLRERSTAMVAQTCGVLLGFLGFKEGKVVASPIVLMAGCFIVLLGCWGIFSSLMFESRARRHRVRIDKILVGLGAITSAPASKVRTLNLVWVIFHLAIIAIGVAVIFYPWPPVVVRPHP